MAGWGETVHSRCGSWRSGPAVSGPGMLVRPIGADGCEYYRDKRAKLSKSFHLDREAEPWNAPISVSPLT